MLTRLFGVRNLLEVKEKVTKAMITNTQIRLSIIKRSISLNFCLFMEDLDAPSSLEFGYG
jgi:hypothetical protein